MSCVGLREMGKRWGEVSVWRLYTRTDLLYMPVLRCVLPFSPRRVSKLTSRVAMGQCERFIRPVILENPASPPSTTPRVPEHDRTSHIAFRPSDSLRFSCRRRDGWPGAKFIVIVVLPVRLIRIPHLHSQIYFLLHPPFPRFTCSIAVRQLLDRGVVDVARGAPDILLALRRAFPAGKGGGFEGAEAVLWGLLIVVLGGWTGGGRGTVSWFKRLSRAWEWWSRVEGLSWGRKGSPEWRLEVWTRLAVVGRFGVEMLVERRGPRGKYADRRGTEGAGVQRAAGWRSRRPHHSRSSRSGRHHHPVKKPSVRRQTTYLYSSQLCPRRRQLLPRRLDLTQQRRLMLPSPLRACLSIAGALLPRFGDTLVVRC